MKILLITSLYPIPDNPARGIFIADRVDLLRKMGHEVRVLNPLPRMLRMHELRRSTLSGVARAPKYTTEDEGHIYHPKYSKFPDDNLMWWTRRSILRLVGKVERWLDQWRPEVISCHTIWPVGELASRLANRWDCPWIATVHGWDFDVGLNGRCKSHISELASDANRLIAVSERLVEVAKDIGSESSESAGSNGGTIECTFIPCHSAVGKDWCQPLRKYRGNWRRGHLEVLFPANPRRPEKRHLLALRALAELETRGWNVSMGGLANVPRQMVFDRMVSCDLTLITSEREAGPLVAREAISCGCPVVGVDVGDLATWLPKHSIAEDESPTSIADAIEATLSQPMTDFELPEKFTSPAVERSLTQLFTQIQ